MDSLFQSVVEADAEANGAMAATELLALTFTNDVKTLPILNRLGMGPVTPIRAGAAKKGDMIIVFNGNSATLGDAVQSRIDFYTVSDLHQTTPADNNGVVLPLVPAVTMVGICGAASSFEKEARGRTLVFSDVKTVLKVDKQAALTKAIQQMAEDVIEGVESAGKPKDGESKTPVEMKVHGVTNLDGNMHTSSEKAGLMGKMLESVVVYRIFPESAIAQLITDGKLMPGKIDEVKMLMGLSANEQVSGRTAEAYPQGSKLNAIAGTQALDLLDDLIRGKYADFLVDLKDRHKLCLQSFTTVDFFPELKLGQPSLANRQNLAAALNGFSLCMEGLTGLDFTGQGEGSLGELIKKLAWSQDYARIEDLYLGYLLERSFGQWWKALATMKKEHVVGLEEEKEGEKRGQAWVRYLWGLLYQNLASASERPHIGFNESKVYHNLIEARSRKRIAERESEEDETERKGKYSGEKRGARGGYEQPVCITHLAGLFGLKDTRDRTHMCTYGGDKCRFHHHESKKEAGTKSEITSLVRRSNVTDQPLLKSLIAAIEADSDLL